MLPSNEIDTLTLTVTDAMDAAHAGQVADGYTMLWAGLESAREAADCGEPWGPELVARWEYAIARYCENYGVEMP